MIKSFSKLFLDCDVYCTIFNYRRKKCVKSANLALKFIKNHVNLFFLNALYIHTRRKIKLHNHTKQPQKRDHLSCEQCSQTILNTTQKNFFPQKL